MSDGPEEISRREFMAGATAVGFLGFDLDFFDDDTSLTTLRGQDRPAAAEYNGDALFLQVDENGEPVLLWAHDGERWQPFAGPGTKDNYPEKRRTGTSYVDELAGGVTGGVKVRDLLGRGLEVASGSLQMLSSIWDGDNVVADVDNSQTATDTLDAGQLGSDLDAAGQSISNAGSIGTDQRVTALGQT